MLFKAIFIVTADFGVDYFHLLLHFLFIDNIFTFLCVYDDREKEVRAYQQFHFNGVH